jgi:hypothetical protein
MECAMQMPRPLHPPKKGMTKMNVAVDRERGKRWSRLVDAGRQRRESAGEIN